MANDKNKTLSLSERMAAMEQQIARLLFGVNQKFEQLNQQLGPLGETVTALVEIAGEKAVNDIIERTRLEAARERADREKKLLEAGVADGYVIAAQAVTDKSILIGRYIGADGNVIEPGRVQLAFPTITQEGKEKLLGKEVGTVVDVGDGTKFELQEIYVGDDEKYKQVMADRQAAMQKAALEAAAAKATEDEKADETATAEEK